MVGNTECTESQIIPINEAVYLLHELLPNSLEILRKELPEIAGELRLGIPAGLTSQKNKVVVEKAKALHRALVVASNEAKRGIELASNKIRISRRISLFGGIMSF